MNKQPKWKARIQQTVRAEVVADLERVARARWAARKALTSIPLLVASK